MYLLVNVLEQPEHLVAILEGFANCGAARPSRWATTRGLIRKALKLTWSKYKDQEV